MKTPSLWMIAAACFIATASVANARSAYDGSWDLVFVTQTGLFDPSYNFTVDITDGVVTHPNLVRFKGYVAKSGSCVGDGRTNSRPAPAGSSGPPVAENGVVARELRDARAIGPPSTNDQLEKRNTVLRATYLREAASDTIAIAATLLFAHGESRNEQLSSPSDIARIGSGHERVLREPLQINDNS